MQGNDDALRAGGEDAFIIVVMSFLCGVYVSCLSDVLI